MPRLRGVALTLVAVAVFGCGCRGFASSRVETTPQPTSQVASSARVTESNVAKVVIDRACSKLADAADEYVCLTNADTAPADLGSWVLRNVLGRSFNFPPGFKLPVGQTVKVHTGAGPDTATDLHWAYRVNPAWETGDKLTLHNQEDVEVFVSSPTKP
jgi:micrococcal nuclease